MALQARVMRERGGASAHRHGRSTRETSIFRTTFATSRRPILRPREYLYFEDDEITLESLQIDANLGRDLFINDVGSWEHRADTVTEVKNLFIAADHCRTPIDVVSLESATFAGLMAAEAIRTRVGLGAPVDIYEPERLPRSLFLAMKAMFAPYAAAAKLWSFFDERPN